MATIFTKIINGDIPCFKLVEDDHFFAFMDIRPINTGHCLVIPKSETDYFFDLQDEQLAGIMLFAKPIAQALEQVVDCERIGIMIAGLEVPHAHVHLIPFDNGSQLSFDHAAPADMEELKTIADQVSAILNT